MKSHEATEKKDLFIELRGFKGMSLDAVCSELSISKTTAMEWEKKFKGYIIQTRAAHFDFLVDSYCLSLEKRLFELKEISEKLRNEISKREKRARTRTVIAHPPPNKNTYDQKIWTKFTLDWRFIGHRSI